MSQHIDTLVRTARLRLRTSKTWAVSQHKNTDYWAVSQQIVARPPRIACTNTHTHTHTILHEIGFFLSRVASSIDKKKAKTKTNEIFFAEETNECFCYKYLHFVADSNVLSESRAKYFAPCSQY